MEDRMMNALREAMNVEEKSISLSDTFRDYDEWDSLAHLTMISILDDEFRVELEGSEFDELKTVEDLIQAVSAKIK